MSHSVRLKLFLGHLPLAAGAPIASADIESALETVAAAAEAAWGTRFLFDGHFAARLAAKVREDADPVAALAAARGADLYLAHAAIEGRGWALEALESGPLAQALRAVARRYSDPTLRDDTRARVLELLLIGGPDGAPKLEQYAGRASMSTWIRAIALRCAAKLATAAGSAPALTDELADRVADSDDALRATLKAGYRQAFRAAFARAVADLSIHDRLLLKLNALDGLSIDEIAAANDVHRATAARWLARIRDKLGELTRRYLGEEIGAEPGDVAAILETIGSRLDASISRLFDGTS